MKINLFVNGNLVCDRSKAREHRGQSSCTEGSLAAQRAVEVITLCGEELPSDYDISDAAIIDGDIHCRSISCNGIVVCKGSFTVIEEGGDYGSL
jgi:hypothetical protein